MPEFTQITAGVFCRELVCGLEPLEDLLESWGLTEDAYHQLRKNEWFQKELLSAVAEVRDLGPNSAFIMRCRALAEEGLPNLFKILENEKNDPRVRIDAFKELTDLGRLKPQKADPSGGGGPSVVFNFGAGLKLAPESLILTPSKLLPESTS